MYGADELARRSIKIRHAFCTVFIEIFPFDTVGGMATDADGERVYRPNYAELDRIVIQMMNHERTRMLNSERLRTDEGDKEFTPRTRQAADMAATDETADIDDNPPPPTLQRQPLLRSKLIIYVGEDGEYVQIKFTDFYDKDALDEPRKKKRGGDLKAEFFSCSKLWELLCKRKIYESVGFLRAVVDPPKEDMPEYIDLDGKIDDVLQDDDNKLIMIMEGFRYQSKHMLAQKFEMTFLTHPRMIARRGSVLGFRGTVVMAAVCAVVCRNSLAVARCERMARSNISLCTSVKNHRSVPGRGDANLVA